MVLTPASSSSTLDGDGLGVVSQEVTDLGDGESVGEPLHAGLVFQLDGDELGVVTGEGLRPRAQRGLERH